MNSTTLFRDAPLAVSLAVLCGGCSTGGDDPGTNTPGDAADPSGAAPPTSVARLDGELFDTARGRSIPYRLFAPIGSAQALPIVLVSHGGAGNARGFTTGGHIGTALAAGGFVALHVGHLPSATRTAHLVDRPADVSFALDRLADGSVALPPDALGTPDPTRVGHTGHSYGAYTSHALGGATFEQVYRDERIDAIAPISPQGPGQFGAFDRGPDDNTWLSVTIPAFDLVGGDEADGNVVGTIDAPDWRLTPFARYPRQGDKFLAVIAGQDHSDMWERGSDEVKRFVGEALTRFFTVYVKDDPAIDACSIGRGDIPGIAITGDRKPDRDATRLVNCP